MRDLFLKRDYYKACFSTPEGQRVLSDLMSFCKYRDSSYVSGDPTGTAFNEGMRRVLLRIIRFLNMTEQELNKITELQNGGPTYE